MDYPGYILFSDTAFARDEDSDVGRGNEYSHLKRTVEGRIIAYYIISVLKTLKFLICHNGTKLRKAVKICKGSKEKSKNMIIFARIMRFCKSKRAKTDTKPNKNNTK